MTHRDLLRRLNDKPFKPFRIRMVNSTIYDITDPWMIVPGDSSALILANPAFNEDRGYQVVHDWKTVSIQHMIEFSDLNPPRDNKRKKAS
jgi:hypothetical protein